MKDLSRFLCMVLRHKPEVLGLKLDKGGWVDVQFLMTMLEERGTPVTEAEIKEMVETNNKKRFVLSQDGTRIKAAQGHSVDVELELKRETPPMTLYHGTVNEALTEIKKKGLLKMRRHHVHLSKDPETATVVGSRRGLPVVLQVEAKRMHNDGHRFFISENGVWLTEHVPVKYIVFPVT